MATYPTDTYTNLKERFKSIAGLQSLETTDEAFLNRQAINRRFRTAYQRYPWYEFTIVGETSKMATADDNQIITYGSNKDLANNADTYFPYTQEQSKRNIIPRGIYFYQYVG